VSVSKDRAVSLLIDQARWCAELGSPLYALLLTRAAEDAAAGGPAWSLMAPDEAKNARADALALRLMAAVHRLVLTGRAPRLAAHYPSAGGSARLPGAAETFVKALGAHAALLSPLVARPCQTNEVGRSAALAFGFLDLAAGSGLPLRLLEIGASAGLNLRFDAYRYAGGEVAWGPPDSPVDLAGLWHDAPPRLPDKVPVVERAGCDPRPVDVATGDGRLDLESSVWADQVARFGRLRGALEVATRVPVRVDRASVVDWLPARLDTPAVGALTVVFHSIVEEYLSEAQRRAFHRTLAEAGARASAEAPLAWLRLEPDPGSRRYDVRLTTWPGGEERLVAHCSPHGAEVRRASA
jgi:hypothetical protein